MVSRVQEPMGFHLTKKPRKSIFLLFILTNFSRVFERSRYGQVWSDIFQNIFVQLNNFPRKLYARSLVKWGPNLPVEQLKHRAYC